MRFFILGAAVSLCGVSIADDGLWLEDVEVIHEIRGEAAGDVFGWIARNLGDVNGDGVDDIFTSAPYKVINELKACGKVYAYSGKTGELLWEREGAPGSLLGIVIGEAGDVNGDGVPDAVCGATGEGKAYVFSGDDGRVLMTFQKNIDEISFGTTAKGVGDVNGDGHADVLIGAPGVAPKDDETKPHAGAAFLYSGKDGALLAELVGEEPGDGFGQSVGGGLIDGTAHLLIGAGNAGEGDRGRMYVYTFSDGETKLRETFESREQDVNYGWMFTSLVGDVDGDGVPDIYTTDWNSNEGGKGAGRIAIYSGRTMELLHDIQGSIAGENFGIGSCEAGDLDGDGCDDFVVGAWQNAEGAKSGGKCYAYSGKTGDLLATYTSTVAGETLGFDTTELGDVNGDGVIDLLLTSGYSPVNGQRSGRVWVVSSGIAASHE